MMRNEYVFMQGYVLCINPKSTKQVIDIRGTCVFEWPGDSLDLSPKKRFEISWKDTVRDNRTIKVSL